MKKLFFDTEFTGLHKATTLISIGIISDCGKKFYAELNDYDELQLNDWLNKNVIDNLFLTDKFMKGDSRSIGNDSDSYPNVFWDNEDLYVRGNTEKVKEELTVWLSRFGEKLEIWSDCLAYDWVLFNNIFGTAFDIPDYIYYIPFDICTVFKDCNVDPDINREEFAFGDDVPADAQKHNALWDAVVIKKCFERLNWDFENKVEVQ